MKLKAMKFGAKAVVPENSNDSGKIDAVNEKIILSDTESLDLKGITEVSKFFVMVLPDFKWGLFHMKSGLPLFLTVIGIKTRENTWVFLCNSQETFLSIGNEFMLSYDLEEKTGGQGMGSRIKTYKGHAGFNAQSLLEHVYNEAECVFAGFLLEEGRQERLRYAPEVFRAGGGLLNQDHEYRITKCRLHIPDNRKETDPVIESCLVSDVWNLDSLYEILHCFLPYNMEKKAVLEMKQIKAEYGKDFGRKKEMLESYRQSVFEKDILPQAEKIQKEMERWIKLTKDHKIEKEFGEAYVKVLQEKMEIIKDKVRHYLEKTDFEPGAEQDCKNRLLEQLGNLQRYERDKGVSLYEDYCEWEDRMEEIERKFPNDTADLKIPQYLEFYRLGRIMIGRCLDRRKFDYERKKQVLQEESDQAMKYFYETDTAKEACKIEKYLENRRKGLHGEKEVDYALKWLDKSYATVPKIADKKHRVNTIALINPDFRNESQEYDHIVIGKQGVFVIETKDYSGKLIIDTYGNWIRMKADGTREGERNPLQQMDRHIKLLRSFLKNDIPIIGVICIAHRKTIIEGKEHCPIPLIKSDMLAGFIEDYPLNGGGLSDDEIKECLSAIEDHRYR